MPQYTERDLQVRNAIETIRAFPHLYSGGEPAEYYWLQGLVRELLFLGVESVDIRKFGHWWRLYSSKDWLEENGTISMVPFSQIIHFPLVGQNAMRTEVVIAALSKALVTVGVDGVHWIVGAPETFALPSDLAAEIGEHKSGRMIIFMVR